ACGWCGWLLDGRRRPASADVLLGGVPRRCRTSPPCGAMWSCCHLLPGAILPYNRPRRVEWTVSIAMRHRDTLSNLVRCESVEQQGMSHLVIVEPLRPVAGSLLCRFDGSVFRGQMRSTQKAAPLFDAFSILQ